MMKLMIAAALGVGLIGSVAAADVEAGRKIADAQCAKCHGEDGKTSADPSYPKLAGQYADYLAKALNDYQSGGRKNAIMGGMAKPLSKSDIQNLAAYFSSLPGPLTHRR